MERNPKYGCATKGSLGPNAECGYCIVGNNKCGASDDYQCQNKILIGSHGWGRPEAPPKPPVKPVA